MPSRDRNEGVEADERMVLAAGLISLLLSSNATCSIPASVRVESCRDLGGIGVNSWGSGTIPDNVSQNSVIASRYRCRLRLSGIPYI